MTLDCGYCGRALELDRLPATLVAQCGFCKKALDLAPVASQLTAPAPAPVPVPVPTAPPAPELSAGTALHLAIAAEAGVHIDRTDGGATLRLRAGTGLHPRTSGLAVIPLMIAMPISFEVGVRPLLAVVAALPALLMLFAFALGRWRIVLTKDALFRSHWPMPGRELRIARSAAKSAAVESSVYEVEDDLIHLFTVVVQVADGRGQVRVAPFLRNASAAAVLEREINAWIRGGAPGVELKR